MTKSKYGWKKVLKGNITKYSERMKCLIGYINHVCTNVADGREEGKGNFKYYHRGITKAQHEQMRELELTLYRENLKKKGLENKTGCCDAKCIECVYPRLQIRPDDKRHFWSSNPKKPVFYCQVECECK